MQTTKDKERKPMSSKESVTDNIRLRGRCRWAKVFPHNKDKVGYKDAYKDCGGAYTIEVFLDEENMQILRDVNSAKEGRVDGDYTVVKFVRKHLHPLDIPSYGGPPRVVHADRSPWDPDQDADGSIGNESLVQIGVSVYDAGKNRGSRLNWVQVLEKVEYEPANDGTGVFDDIPDATQEAPKPKKPAKKAAPKKDEVKTNADLDDEIPF